MNRIVTTLLLLFTLTLGMQADNKVKRPDTYNYNRGMECYHNDQYDEALQYFLNELSDNPKNGYAYMYVADIKREAEETGAALSAANNAIKYMPAKDKELLAVAYKIRGKIHCMLKDTTAALADYEQQIKAMPDVTDSYSDRAQLLYELGQYDRSSADYQKMVSIDPGESEGFLGQGRNLQMQERWQESVEMLTKASMVDASNSTPYAFRATAYLSLKEWGKATDDLIRALDIDGNNRAFWHTTLLKDPALSMMLAKMKLQMAKQPNNDMWPYYIGMCYETNDEYAKAITFYEKAQQLNADKVNPFRMALCYDKLGLYDRAMDCIAQSQALDSMDTGTLSMRAELLYSLGRTQEAVAQYDEVLGIDPSLAGAYYRRAWIKRVGLRDYEAASDDIDLCIAAGGEDASVYELRGECFAALGRKEQAREAFKRVVELEPTPADYDVSHYAHLALGDTLKAIEVIDTIIARDGTKGNIYDAACLYSRMHNRPKAMAYLKQALEMGYNAFGHMELDSDMDFLRTGADYRTLVDEYRRKHEEQIAASATPTVHPSDGSGKVTEVPFTKENGMCNIKCSINNLPLYFVFDTGAATVSLSMVEATFMMKNGYLSRTDVVGSERFMDANGNVSEGTLINLRHVDFGGLKLENVRASVVRNQRAPLLLGQSVLSRLGRIEINNVRNVLTVTGR